MSNGTLDDVNMRYQQLWGKNGYGVIPYTIASGFGPRDRANIGRAIQYLERVSCLRFEGVSFDSPKKPRMDFIATNDNYCHANFYGGAKIHADIKLGRGGGCRAPRTITHEILH